MNNPTCSTSICELRVVKIWLLLLSISAIATGVVEAGRRSNKKNKKNPPPDMDSIQNLDYVTFPRRTQDEAAVLEWGHSAIISALDASVAMFGPQTSQAALLEVECMPILASPLNGVFEDDDDYDDYDEDGDEEEEVEGESGGEAKKKKKNRIRPLDNAEDVHGNMVVMTNTGDVTGVQMAKIAKASGAAALLVVNIDEDRPDDIYRLEVIPEVDGDQDLSDIDIPVVMVSMNSANVFTSATVTPEMTQADIVNHGMPERVRLYAGGDRPFFEDVEPIEPTLYLIHNLLTTDECNELIDSAKHLVAPVVPGKEDPLQLHFGGSDNFISTDRVTLWSGMLVTPAKKVIEERIEQVTGFPATHYSDFLVDKLQPPHSKWLPHYDIYPGLVPPMATITVFLSDDDENKDDDKECMLYPMCRQPVKIKGRKGMAVVHHNTNEQNQLDPNTIHAMLSGSRSNKPIYVARKYIFATPDGMARKLALPILAAPFGGKLPGMVVNIYDHIVNSFAGGDPIQGGLYFDKLCIFLPVLVLLGLAQIITDKVQKGMAASSAQKKRKENNKFKTTKDSSTDTTTKQQHKNTNKTGSKSSQKKRKAGKSD